MSCDAAAAARAAMQTLPCSVFFRVTHNYLDSTDYIQSHHHQEHRCPHLPSWTAENEFCHFLSLGIQKRKKRVKTKTDLVKKIPRTAKKQLASNATAPSGLPQLLQDCTTGEREEVRLCAPDSRSTRSALGMFRIQIVPPKIDFPPPVSVR